MQAQMYESKVFNDVFPTYESFINWISVYEIPVPTKLTFSLIQAEYRDSHLAYNEEGFKDHFFIDLYTYVKEFEATTRAINDLMNLTDEDISTNGSMITNTADVPENLNTTDAEEINFVSQQQKMINKKGNLQIKREQLSNKRVYTVRTFLKRFKHLFIKVLSPAYTYVVEEPEGV